MFEKIKKIDTHVHFRDWEQAYKETIRGGLEKAATQGIIAVGDMPNTKPLILWEENVRERLKLAAKEKSLVRYFLWLGLTSKRDQIEEAVRLEREIPQVIGFKLYAGPTTGDLCVTDEREQEKVYEILSELDYKGVLAVHCEKEKELKPELWNPEEPWTYGLSRPPKAEIVGTKEQIKFARKTNFPGHLHICHISLSETLEIVKKAREEGLNISGEITPHHFLLSEDKMREKNGLRWKVNPPLRKPVEQEELKRVVMLLIQEGIDWLWIATDYAAHTSEEKVKSNGPSGIADYSLYSQLLNWFKEKGLSSLEIERLTFHNIVKIFGEKFKF